MQVLGHKGLQFDLYFSLKTFFLNSDVKQEACLKSVASSDSRFGIVYLERPF